MTRTPLNGTKTHPLKQASIEALNQIARGPAPRQEFNAGVIDRLLREDLIEMLQIPSPYHKPKGLIAGVKITAAGRAVLGL